MSFQAVPAATTSETAATDQRNIAFIIMGLIETGIAKRLTL
jgi:hypothetical protein